MRKPANALLEAMDQMEQIPGIAGVWSEVRCQTRHTKPMRKTDWAFITSSVWLYVNTEREASCPEWVYILSRCCLHLALGHIREDRKTDAVWEHACDCIASKMLLDLRIGRPPAEFAEAPPANAKEETAFYHWLLEHPTAKIPRFATMTDGRTGMIFDWLPSGQDWARLFAEDLQWSIRQTLRGWTNGTAMHMSPGRAGKVVVSFLLSAAGSCCSTVPPDRRQRCRFPARCQHCSGILPYGRNLYQSVCRTAHRGMAVCSGA